ncbi:MAG TPA: VCBS repeat-containing protein [Planctomycetota bacterium]|nr:VCBS repeat-containing protein [Planctomycetota bacterium]
MKLQTAHVLVLTLLAGLLFLMGPRPVHEPWVAEEVSAGEAASRGLSRFTRLIERLEPDALRARALAGGLRPERIPPFGGSAQLIDADGDGDLDLFAERSAVEAGAGEAGAGDRGVEGSERMQFHLNDGGGQFREVGRLLGPAFSVPRKAHGSACADMDGDGRPDILVELEGGSYLILWNRLHVKGRDRKGAVR